MVFRWTVQRPADFLDSVGIEGGFLVFMDFPKVRAFACHYASPQRYTSLSKDGFPHFNSYLSTVSFCPTFGFDVSLTDV